MLTALLWTTLIASAILLIAIASPIRLSCKAVYNEGKQNTELRAAAHYIHPLFLRTEYSTKDGEFKIFIFGFEKKRGGGKEDIVTENIGTNGIDTKDTNTDGINTDGINTDGANTDSIDTDGSIDTEDMNTSDDTDTKEKKFSLVSKIKSKIDDIKRNKAYKAIGNKPLREKLLRWLKRSSIRVVRAISFEKLKIHVRIGLNDPAALGKMYGYFSAAQSASALQHYRADLSMTPIFTEKCLDIDSELSIKTTLSIILWQLTAIAATFPYWRVWKITRG